MFMPALAPAATIDATSGGVEVIAPNQMIFHNLLVPSQSTYYFGVFQWSPSQNKWNLIDHGLEDPTFSSQEYYPLEQGRSWTYQRSDGGQLVLTVAGAQQVCGQTCIRLNGSDGSSTYWINDATGIWMTRYVQPDTSYTDFCPPMKIAPPQLYLGTQSLDSFNDAGVFVPPGIQVASVDGWSQFTAKGLEDVTVPAGTFLDCIRATYTFSYTASDGSYAVRTEETWYSEGVGIVKRVQTEAYGMGGMIFHSGVRCYDLASYTMP
jgi:hypothetical protein